MLAKVALHVSRRSKTISVNHEFREEYDWRGPVEVVPVYEYLFS